MIRVTEANESWHNQRELSACITALQNAHCNTYEWVMSQIWMSHDKHSENRVPASLPSGMLIATRMNESRQRYESVMSQIWMSHNKHSENRVPASLPSAMLIATRMNESCHANESIMVQTVKRRCLHCCPLECSRSTYEWVVPQIWMSHVTEINQSRHTQWKGGACIVPSEKLTATHINEICHTH